MKMNGSIVVYGNTAYATALFKRYEIADRIHEICYFIITDTSEDSVCIGDRKVYSFDEKKNDLENREVIIALPQEMIVEARKKLESAGAGFISHMTEDEFRYSRSDSIELCRSLPVKRDKVVFYCFCGRGYLCNCKYIAEYLRKSGWRDLVWVIREDAESGTESLPDGIRVVERFSLEYYKEVYTAGFLITNLINCPDIEKKKEQYYINTWHGIGPFKAEGLDSKCCVRDVQFKRNYIDDHAKADLRIAASYDCVDMYRKSMLYEGEILTCGYPRNDIFFQNGDLRDRVRRKIGIDGEQFTILYAPTFRDDSAEIGDSFRYYDLDVPRIVRSFEKKFGRRAVFMYRFHQNLYECVQCSDFYRAGINVTLYPDTQELLLAADVLITDYSSIMWDFSLTGKPVFLYQNDVEEYKESRGFYSPPETWPYPQAKDTDELCRKIEEYEDTAYHGKLKAFFEKYGSFDNGHASECVEEKMQDVLCHPEKYGKDNTDGNTGFVGDFFSNRCLMPRVSVIVPVYNTEEYLKECLDSILAQTLTDIEVICVDDGSTDGSAAILDEYAIRDPRVKVIHKVNGGYGSAINEGFRHSCGEYVGIVESDDAIMRNMYERLYHTAKDNGNLDFVKSQCYFCYDRIGYRIPWESSIQSFYFNRVLESEDRIHFFDFLMNTWSGIYRRDFLLRNHILHHETPGASFQDNGFWLQTMCLAERAMWLPDHLYLYRQDNAASSVHDEGKPMEMRAEFAWAEERLRERWVDERIIKYIHYWRLFRHRGNLTRIADDLRPSVCPQIIEDYGKYGYALPDDGRDSINVWYKRFLSNPQGFCTELNNRRKQLTEKLTKAKNIAIYGTGARGQRVMRILFLYGFYEKLKMFLQTDGIAQTRIGEMPVRSPFDPETDMEDELVILGTTRGSRAHDAIVKVLQDMGIDEIVEGEDLFENFYLIY